MIRVMLVDDHAVVRTGFRLLLQAQTEVVVVAELFLPIAVTTGLAAAGPVSASPAASAAARRSRFTDQFPA